MGTLPQARPRKVRCVKLEYRAAFQKNVPSLSKQDPGKNRQDFPAYAHIEVRGGWAYVSAPSQLILTIDVAGKAYEVCVGEFFKDKLGPLTQQRQKAIRATMPKNIMTTDSMGPRGRYFVATNADLTDWLKRIEPTGD